MSAAIDQSNSISAKVVPAHLRAATLPKKFPGMFLIYEFLVYRYMEDFSNEYSGGYWEFIELSNGGFYLSLKSNSRFYLTVASNGFEGETSADAASLIANLFTLWQLAHEHELNYLTEMFHALRDYACEHAEANHILGAID